MLKNLRRRVVAITAAALMVTATAAPAFAAPEVDGQGNMGFAFHLGGAGESWGQPNGWITKTDYSSSTSHNAYLTINNSYNWTSSDNAYIWVEDQSYRAYTDDNRPFTHYVTSCALPYITMPAKSVPVGLAAWHRNYNGSTKNFDLWGKWHT